MYPAPPVQGAQALAAQLQQLADHEGFDLTGLERLEPGAQGKKTDEASVPRIKRLLEGYDYAIVHAGEDRIKRLIILGKKRDEPPDMPPLASPGETAKNVIPTQRRSGHHWVTATLVGPGGEAESLDLMVDTGASLVVLPSSKAVKLGLDLSRLEVRPMQTAKGKLQARIGRLRAIELGSLTVEEVQAAFVDDRHLGGNALLGMNVLGRYVFVLDDDRSELTLIPNGGVE